MQGGFVGIRALFFYSLMIFFAWEVSAQEKTTLKDYTQDKIEFFTFVDLWARYTEMNPGTTINQAPVNQQFDWSIRRFRIGASGYVAPKLFVKIQMGVNNVNPVNQSTDLQIFDLYAKYDLKNWFKIGIGKSNAMGLSRFSSIASSTMITTELPIFALSTINVSDHLTRRLSTFVEGQVGHLDYNFVLAQPFLMSSTLALSENASFSTENPAFQPSGYLMYQFFEHESQKNPTAVGSYFGTKKIANIGVGFQQQRNAMWTQNSNGDTIRHQMLNLAVDAYLDMPLNSDNSKSINFYLGYFNYDFGPGYIRAIGINNPANGTSDAAYLGFGNAYPAIGTGQTLYTHVGFRIATPKLKFFEAIMPYVAVTRSDFDRLEKTMFMIDGGINWLLHGHNSKFTLGLQNRPVYIQTDASQYTQSDRKLMGVLQYQFKIG